MTAHITTCRQLMKSCQIMHRAALSTHGVAHAHTCVLILNRGRVKSYLLVPQVMQQLARIRAWLQRRRGTCLHIHTREAVLPRLERPQELLHNCLQCISHQLINCPCSILHCDFLLLEVPVANLSTIYKLCKATFEK